MFISQKEADERLKSNSNLLRHQSNDRKESQVPGGSDIPDLPDEQEHKSEDDPAEGLLSSLDKLDEIILNRPRASYQMNRPAQKAIAETTLLMGPSVSGALFGLSHAQVNAYQNGVQHDTSDALPIPEVKRHLAETKERIALIAARKLRKTLKCITTEKVEEIQSPLDAGRLAKDLASVVDKMEPKEKIGDRKVEFHIYRPVVKTLNEYKVVNVAPRQTKNDEASA